MTTYTLLDAESALASDEPCCWVTLAMSRFERVQQRSRCLLIDKGLAIAERKPGCFSITHVASGFCIGGDSLTEAKAREVFAKLLPIADWTSDKPKPSVRKLTSIGGIVKKGALVGWK